MIIYFIVIGILFVFHFYIAHKIYSNTSYLSPRQSNIHLTELKMCWCQTNNLSSRLFEEIFVITYCDNFVLPIKGQLWWISAERSGYNPLKKPLLNFQCKGKIIQSNEQLIETFFSELITLQLRGTQKSPLIVSFNNWSPLITCQPVNLIKTISPYRAIHGNHFKLPPLFVYAKPLLCNIHVIVNIKFHNCIISQKPNNFLLLKHRNEFKSRISNKTRSRR